MGEIGEQVKYFWARRDPLGPPGAPLGEGPREAGGEREWGGEGTQEGVCCGEKQEAGRCGCGRKAMHTWPNIPRHWLT